MNNKFYTYHTLQSIYNYNLMIQWTFNNVFIRVTRVDRLGGIQVTTSQLNGLFHGYELLKFDKRDAIRGANVTSNHFTATTLFTANRDITQKNGFYYHNFVF